MSGNECSSDPTPGDRADRSRLICMRSILTVLVMFFVLGDGVLARGVLARGVLAREVLAREVEARGVEVGDVKALREAWAAAGPGDVIRVAPGEYERAWLAGGGGSVESPVIIQAADPQREAHVRGRAERGDAPVGRVARGAAGPDHHQRQLQRLEHRRRRPPRYPRPRRGAPRPHPPTGPPRPRATSTASSSRDSRTFASSIATSSAGAGRGAGSIWSAAATA